MKVEAGYNTMFTKVKLDSQTKCIIPSFGWRASSHWVLGLQKVELTIMEVEL
jgi:hypothetical protein